MKRFVSMTPEWIPHRIKLAVLVIVLGGMWLLFRIWVVCYATMRLESDLSQIDTGEVSPVSPEDETEIYVHLSKDGTITVDDEPVTDVFAALDRLVPPDRRSDVRIVLSCDERASYEQVVSVLNQISKARIKNVTFAVGEDF